MRRAPIALVLVVASLLLAGLAAAAASGAVQTTVGFKFKADHGLTASLENSGEEITLTFAGHREYVSYQVDGKVSEQGVEASFGKLGQISVAFRPTRTIDSSAPPSGCSGEPWTTKKGVFEGTIHFRGERGYVEVDTAAVRGEVEAYPEWKCKGELRPTGPRMRAVGAKRAGEEGDVATLVATLPGGPARFAALAIRDPENGNYTIFYGGRVEKREGMRIARIATCAARSSSFVFDHAEGTATVSPPWPFRGSAAFRRHRGGTNSWTGSLRVPLLGASPAALAGRRFEVSLVRNFPSD